MSSPLAAGLLGALLGVAPSPPHPPQPQPAFDALADRPSLCRLEEVAVLPLRMTGYYLTTPATLDGDPLSLIVDTGSEGSLLTPEAAEKFRLQVDPRDSVVIAGADGKGVAVPVADVPSMRLGNLRLANLAFPLGALPGLPMIQPPVLGILGMNVLGHFDVDMDLPRRRLGLWDVRRASSICPAPPRWNGRWVELPARMSGGRFLIPFVLDGHKGTALLDSGARSHILSTAFARRIGVSANTLARDPGGVSAGVGSSEHAYHWHRFHALEIAGETRAQPVLTVAPLTERADMLLGADWFATRNVWLSPPTRPGGEGRVYVQDENAKTAGAKR